MHFTPIFAFAVLLAGQALALDINITSLGTIQANQFLTVQDSDLTTQCQAPCSTANNAIMACADDACLCNNTTVPLITACQQCYFTTIIEENRQMPDPRAGSTPALAAYVAACAAPSVNVTVPPTSVALTLPSDWEGPFDATLNLGETIIYVASGAIISIGSITMLCTM